MNHYKPPSPYILSNSQFNNLPSRLYYKFRTNNIVNNSFIPKLYSDIKTIVIVFNMAKEPS